MTLDVGPHQLLATTSRVDCPNDVVTSSIHPAGHDGAQVGRPGEWLRRLYYRAGGLARADGKLKLTADTH